MVKKDLDNHLQACMNGSESSKKCNDCLKEYDKDLEIRHFNKECVMSVSCSKCNLKVNKSELPTHDCLSYLLKHKDENKRNKKLLKKKNEKLLQMIHQCQKKYKDLIRNEGHFCSFCESPLLRQQCPGVNFCKLCSKMSCKSCKYENMFYCHECKHNYCTGCSLYKKVLICDMHWNV